VTVPFAQIPVGLANDGRVAALPSGAETLLYRLYLRAATCTEHRDRIPLQRGVAYATAVRFIVGEDTSRLDAIIREGLAVIEGDYLRLTVTVASLSSEAPVARTTSHTEAPRGAVPEGVVPGKPSTSKAAQRARNDRLKFGHRAAPFKGIDPTETWESWIESGEGVAFLAEREHEFPGYRAWVTPKVTRGSAVRNTPGNTQVTPHGNAPLKTTSSSGNSEERKKEEGEGNARGTPQGNGKGNTLEGVTLLEALATAAGDRATLPITGGAFERGAVKALAGVKLTRDELTRAGEALARPSDWWPSGKDAPPKHCTWKSLAGYPLAGGEGYEFGPLLALVAHVRATRRPSTPPAPAQAPAYIPQPAVQAATRAYLAAQRNASAPTPTQEKTDA
jgi:hypothetical protein